MSLYSVYLDKGQGACWNAGRFWSHFIRKRWNTMALCIYFWSIGAPILLGDGVLDEGPISENKSFTMLWKKLKGQLHDMYLALITSSSLANLSHSSSASATSFATLKPSYCHSSHNILWYGDLVRFFRNQWLKTPEHHPALPQASTGGVQQGSQADKVSHSLQQVEPWMHKIYSSEM